MFYYVQAWQIKSVRTNIVYIIYYQQNLIVKIKR